VGDFFGWGILGVGKLRGKIKKKSAKSQFFTIITIYVISFSLPFAVSVNSLAVNPRLEAAVCWLVVDQPFICSEFTGIANASQSGQLSLLPIG